MQYRLAVKEDAKRLFNLLEEVQDLHATGRPDIFIKGASKYTIKGIENIIENENPIATFSSTDNRFSIEFPKEYGFVSYSPSGDKLLELRNDKNLNIFVSSKDLMSNKSLSDIVSADITSYLEEFSNSSNISGITEFVHNEKPAFTYSFHYLDFSSKTTYYLQVMWLEYENNYYIIDVEFPLDDLYDNTSIINDILNNFKVN